MNVRLRIVLAVAGVGASLALAGTVLAAGDARYGAPPPTERILYLRSGRVAGRLMLSFDALAADVYWIRAIQHYGRDRQSTRLAGRFELLYPLLDLTTTLDPYFVAAYRFGAIFLASPMPDGPGRVDQAAALLEKGLRWSPDQWRYAFDLGFVYYWYGSGGPQPTADFAAAARWFERAADLPGGPSWLRPLAAATRVRGGDRTGARRLLQTLGESEEPWLRAGAERALRQLNALDDIDRLQSLADAYLAAHQTRPSRWTDLIAAARNGQAPLDPAGFAYDLDPSTGRVGLSPRSPLWPLPSTLGHQ